MKNYGSCVEEVFHVFHQVETWKHILVNYTIHSLERVVFFFCRSYLYDLLLVNIIAV